MQTLLHRNWSESNTLMSNEIMYTNHLSLPQLQRYNVHSYERLPRVNVPQCIWRPSQPNVVEPVKETPTQLLLNPLVLAVCVCDKYRQDLRLPGNEKDLNNIRNVCRILNYKDIKEINVDDIGQTTFVEHFLRPARQHLNESNDHDGLLFFYSGHGSEHSLDFPGNETYKWQFIFDFFSGKDENCPILADKPKVFVIDSCRGGNVSHSVQAVSGKSITYYIMLYPHSVPCTCVG